MCTSVGLSMKDTRSLSRTPSARHRGAGPGRATRRIARRASLSEPIAASPIECGGGSARAVWAGPRGPSVASSTRASPSGSTRQRCGRTGLAACGFSPLLGDTLPFSSAPRRFRPAGLQAWAQLGRHSPPTPERGLSISMRACGRRGLELPNRGIAAPAGPARRAPPGPAQPRPAPPHTGPHCPLPPSTVKVSPGPDRTGPPRPADHRDAMGRGVWTRALHCSALLHFGVPRRRHATPPTTPARPPAGWRALLDGRTALLGLSASARSAPAPSHSSPRNHATATKKGGNARKGRK